MMGRRPGGCSAWSRRVTFTPSATAAYDQGGEGLVFEEGVDGYVPYAGDLTEGLRATLAKIKATMVSCGSVNLREFHSSARLMLVSQQSFEESHPSVIVRDTAATVA